MQSMIAAGDIGAVFDVLRFLDTSRTHPHCMVSKKVCIRFRRKRTSVGRRWRRGHSTRLSMAREARDIISS